jgi:putative ABC transport system ATP-binding protein
MDLRQLERSPGPPIRTVDLEMVYHRGADEVRALDRVNLSIPSGQFVVVRGRSGSGKSTLMHLIAGLRKATAGQVLVGDTDIQALPVSDADRFRRRNVGMIFQFFNLIPSLSVEMNIALPLLLDGYKLPNLRRQIDDLIELLSMSHRRKHAPHELSGGEMQRVAIARALIIKPVLILADEPTGNLDSRASEEIFSLLRDLSRERGVTTIVMTHEVEATKYADRVLVMSDGRVIADSTESVGAEAP